MRHLVNFGLLFSFLALAITGGWAYFRPFSLTATQVHLLAGFITLALVVLHLSARLTYFRNRTNKGQGRDGFRKQLLILLILFGGLLYAAVENIPPVSWLIDGSYESRNRAEIVRSSSLAAFSKPAPHRKLIIRDCREKNSSGLSVLLHFPENLKTMPSVAVWAESTTGSMIETLYLEQSLAYSPTPLWEDYRTKRHHILPLWRHRYTLVSGIAPSGDVDSTSGATQSHQYALDPYLVKGQGKEFVLCVEINAPFDSNPSFPDELLGQPSLIYTCLIEVDRDEPYYLFELTGHGGGDAIETGNFQYDFDGIGSALHLRDLFLTKVEK
jgi:cytochrome b561